MSNFKNALFTLLKYEGGYVNDPLDPGGETYCGISRKYFPNWVGWVSIDEYKLKNSKVTGIIPDLEEKVENFYKITFWDRFKGDDINVEAVSTKLLDMSVNLGLVSTIGFLQKTLNIFGCGLQEDGIHGSKTHAALLSQLKKSNGDVIVKILSILQGYHYLEVVTKYPDRKMYLKGWLNRIN